MANREPIAIRGKSYMDISRQRERVARAIASRTWRNNEPDEVGDAAIRRINQIADRYQRNIIDRLNPGGMGIQGYNLNTIVPRSVYARRRRTR